MHDPRNLRDMRIEQSHRVGIGEHQAGRIRPGRAAQGIQIHIAVAVRGDIHHFKAGHRCTGGIGSMGGIRNDHLRPGKIAPGPVPGLDQQQSGKFPVGACRRLQGHGVHPGDFTQIPFRQAHHFQAALNALVRLQRVYVRKPGLVRRCFQHSRVVLHGAGTQRVKAAVYAPRFPGQFRIMPVHLVFRQFRQPQGPFPQREVQGRLRSLRKISRASAGHASFKDQLHACSTSFTMAAVLPISSGVFISVAHQRIFPSPSGSPPRISSLSSAARIRSACASSAVCITNS